jgi:hypothetical protein
MATPISKGGPPVVDLSGAEKQARQHPGFYRGDDAVEWATNQAQIRRHQIAEMREGAYADRPAIQQRIEHIAREAEMFEHLVKKATAQ